ncbi:hypothetical protein ACLGIH_01900 [Streptomyces sp. HMX87]|uniref:hypothetical protein n=1 Tax=Streptomyces sp. HMX87 TaxID=3390849 RepID=UPI003A89A0E8
MLGQVTEVFDGAVNVLVVALGLGCVGMGWRAVLRPRRPPEPIRGPVWVVRAWGLGFVLVGISITVDTVILMAGGEHGRVMEVTRWVSGPLVVGSVLAGFVARRRERRRAGAVSEGRKA